MRFSHILMAYFLIGATMWAGGAVSWSDAGVGNLFVDNVINDDLTINESTADNLERSGGPIQEAASQIGGGALLAIWNMIVGVIGFMFWPILTLASVGAPPRVSVVAGGALVVGFFGAIIRVFRTSA